MAEQKERIEKGLAKTDDNSFIAKKLDDLTFKFKKKLIEDANVYVEQLLITFECYQSEEELPDSKLKKLVGENFFNEILGFYTREKGILGKVDTLSSEPENKDSSETAMIVPDSLNKRTAAIIALLNPGDIKKHIIAFYLIYVLLKLYNLGINLHIINKKMTALKKSIVGNFAQSRNTSDFIKKILSICEPFLMIDVEKDQGPATVDGTQQELENILKELETVKFTKLLSLFSDKVIVHLIASAQYIQLESEKYIPENNLNLTRVFVTTSVLIKSAINTIHAALRVVIISKSILETKRNQNIIINTNEDVFPIIHMFCMVNIKNASTATGSLEILLPLRKPFNQCIEFFQYMKQEIPVQKWEELSAFSRLNPNFHKLGRGSSHTEQDPRDSYLKLKDLRDKLDPNRNDVADNSALVFDPETQDWVPDLSTVRYKVLDFRPPRERIRKCKCHSWDLEMIAALSTENPLLKTIILTLPIIYSLKHDLTLLQKEELAKYRRGILYIEPLLMALGFAAGAYASFHPYKLVNGFTRILEALTESLCHVTYTLGFSMLIYLNEHASDEQPDFMTFLNEIALGPIIFSSFFFVWNSIPPKIKNQYFPENSLLRFIRKGGDLLNKILFYSGLTQLVSRDILIKYKVKLESFALKMLYQFSPLALGLPLTIGRYFSSFGERLNTGMVYVFSGDFGYQLCRDLLPDSPDTESIESELMLIRRILWAAVPIGAAVIVIPRIGLFQEHWCGSPALFTRVIIVKPEQLDAGADTDADAKLDPERAQKPELRSPKVGRLLTHQEYQKIRRELEAPDDEGHVQLSHGNTMLLMQAMHKRKDPTLSELTANLLQVESKDTKDAKVAKEKENPSLGRRRWPCPRFEQCAIL